MRILASGVMTVAVAVGVSAALLAVAARAEPGADESAGVEVDGAVQVTHNLNPARGHMMPSVAVHPDDDRILAVAEGDAYGGGCAVHISTNRGLSWHPAELPEIPDRWDQCTFQNVGTLVDAAFSEDGTLYYAFNGFDTSTEEGRVFLARSEDLGSSWRVTGLPRIERDLEAGEVGIDALPSIAVDPEDPDRVHVAWTSNWGSWTLSDDTTQGQDYYWDIIMRPYIATSTDGGTSFSEPINLAEDLWLSDDIEGIKTPPEVLAGTDGRVHVVFGERTGAGPRDDPQGDAPPASVYVTSSDDGGETFDGEAVYTEPEPEDRTTAFIWPARGAIDVERGNLYVTWEQLSNAGQPVFISMVRSTGGGETWSDPVEVNDEEPPRKFTYMELFPDISVAPNGRVDIAWYDPRNDPTVKDDDETGASAVHDVYYTYSVDQGETWAPNERITDRPIDRGLGTFSTGDIQGTLGIASTDETAYIAWDDTRNADEETQSQDIYFTRARHVPSESFFGDSTEGKGDRLATAGVGAGAALAFAGLLLVGTVRMMRREETTRES